MSKSDLSRVLLAICVWLGFAASGAATRLSTEVEIQLVTGVGFTPQTVTLDNTYTSAVPVCTYNLPSTASPPVVPRVSNITATSFDLSIQSMPNTDPGVTGSVHCIIAEEGLHTLPDGRQFQAITANVFDVLGLSAGNFEETVNISASVDPGFANPIALGAVISSNDARATAFYANDCEGRGNEPFLSGVTDGICVGYHIGQQADMAPPNQSYAAETVGVIVVDEGTGTANGITYLIDRGPNTIDGVANNGAAYTISGDFEIGVATQAAENGGQGGWAVLLGADPLPNGQLRLAIEEEIVAGDTTRTHTREIVDYWVFRNDAAPTLTLDKTATTSMFAVAGETIDYEYLVENTGNTQIDNLIINDDLIASVSCPTTSLAPTETVICTASYTVTPADVQAGAVTNNAAASGLPFNGTLTPPTDTVTVTLMSGTADLLVEKTVAVFDPLADGLFAVPGNDVLYTITVTNQGTGPVDDGTIFLVDALPPEVIFFNGDADGPGPSLDRIIFADFGTGITFDPLADVLFATGTTPPLSETDCNHTPVPGFDAAVSFLCFVPQGEMQAGIPDPQFTLTFRARLR
jgi:uncharacterized repeat protein (TIGR01451 family)